MELRQIKELLESNTKVLTTQIEMNREIVSIKFGELKEDLSDIKTHIKEINGQVRESSDSILILEEKQCQESKRRKRLWAVSLAAITTMFGSIVAYMLHKF